MGLIVAAAVQVAIGLRILLIVFGRDGARVRLSLLLSLNHVLHRHDVVVFAHSDTLICYWRERGLHVLFGKVGDLGWVH